VATRRLARNAFFQPLRTRRPSAKTKNEELRIPPAVEVGIVHGLPEPGTATAQMKVLDQQASRALCACDYPPPLRACKTLFLRVNDLKVHLRADAAEISADSSQLRVPFPSCDGYVEKVPTLSW
jgi:hypothetical protein